MEQFNACRTSMLNFEKSNYISLAKEVYIEEQALRTRIDKQCAIFTHLFHKTLLFEQAWTDNIDGIKTMISNM
jgi:hypothetical protein